MKNSTTRTEPIICVALNPAIDRVIHIPKLVNGGVMQGRLAGRFAGGKAVNVARVLSALGQTSTVTGFVGEESLDFYQRSLIGTRIKPAFVSFPGTTRENITLLQEAAAGDTHFRCDSSPIQRKQVEELTDLLLELAEEDATFVFSGSLPAGLSLSQFRRMLQGVAAVGAKVVVDTSGPALQVAAKADVWLLKPNVEELSELAGRKLKSQAQLIAAAREFCSDGQEVLLSAGAQGAMLITSDLACRAYCPLVQRRIVSTVGAGDALLAGYLAAVARNLPPPPALGYAVAAATAGLTCTQCALVEMADVMRMQKHVTVEQM